MNQNPSKYRRETIEENTRKRFQPSSRLLRVIAILIASRHNLKSEREPTKLEADVHRYLDLEETCVLFEGEDQHFRIKVLEGRKKKKKWLEKMEVGEKKRLPSSGTLRFLKSWVISAELSAHPTVHVDGWPLHATVGRGSTIEPQAQCRGW